MGDRSRNPESSTEAREGNEERTEYFSPRLLAELKRTSVRTSVRTEDQRSKGPATEKKSFSLPLGAVECR